MEKKEAAGKDNEGNDFEEKLAEGLVKLKKQNRKRWIICGVAVVLVLVGAVVGYLVVGEMRAKAVQEGIVSEVENGLGKIFVDVAAEVPSERATVAEIERMENIVRQLKREEYAEWKEEKLEKLERAKEYALLKIKFEMMMEEGNLKLEVTSEQLAEARKTMEKMREGYRNELENVLKKLEVQKQAIDDVRREVREMFTDEARTVVRGNLVRDEFNTIKTRAESLPQKEIASELSGDFEKIEAVLKQREIEAEEARRRAYEAWLRAEELRKQREREIAAAWVGFEVPYHSQTDSKIYNGCEAASMLMALQYKGYLAGMDLVTYVEMMPKSTDPFQGFTYSVYDLEPKTAAHWIAPAPLVKFGKESSGNMEIVEVTGASLDELDREVEAGNPVIIYLTWLFNPVKGWAEGAPLNLHVMLLTGYNTETGSQRVTDPWTQADGGRTYDLSKELVEGLYNETGRRAIVVR